MKKQLLDELMVITDEEKEILKGNGDVKKEIYTDTPTFVIDSEKLLKKGKYITVRTHTRFIDFPPHSHNYIEIAYVCKGSITHQIDGKEIKLLPGDLLFMNQHVKHGIKKAEQSDIGINFIALPEFFDIPLSMLGKGNILADFLVNTLRRDTYNPQYLVFGTSDNMAVENLMENIVMSLLHGGDHEDNINQISMGLIFLHLLNHIDTVREASSQSYRDILINTTLQYINYHYKDATLTELAQDMNQSVSGLCKMIKRGTGFTFQELLQRQRFRKAVELLIETGLTIADIMAAVGYENSSYFYRKFHEKYKMSPREYRIKHKYDKEIRL